MLLSTIAASIAMSYNRQAQTILRLINMQIKQVGDIPLKSITADYTNRSDATIYPFQCLTNRTFIERDLDGTEIKDTTRCRLLHSISQSLIEPGETGTVITSGIAPALMYYSTKKYFWKRRSWWNLQKDGTRQQTFRVFSTPQGGVIGTSGTDETIDIPFVFPISETWDYMARSEIDINSVDAEEKYVNVISDPVAGFKFEVKLPIYINNAYKLNDNDEIEYQEKEYMVGLGMVQL